MIDFWLLLPHTSFLLAAFFAALLASLAGGIVGSYVVVKRIAFISGSIAHAILGGVGLASYLHYACGFPFLSPLLGALIAALVAALVMGWVHLNYKEREDSIIGAIWAIGMSLGIILIHMTPSHHIELEHYLLGNILWITSSDLLFLALLDALLIFIALLFHKKLLLLCFDEEQAKLQGVAVGRTYLLLLTMISITVVLLIHMVGIVLVLAMLTIPPMIASHFTQRLSRMILWAIALSAFFSILGLNISYAINTPPGATIALLSGLGYIVSLLFI